MEIMRCIMSSVALCRNEVSTLEVTWNEMFISLCREVERGVYR